MNDSALAATSSSKHRVWHWALPVALILLCAGGGIWYWNSRGVPAEGSQPDAGGNDSRNKHGSAVTVQVIHPKEGGIDNVCLQPGTIEPYESADLYAKVSGFLKSASDSKGQLINYGTEVTKGQVIAEISVPEYVAQVHHDKAEVDHANARVEQYVASLDAAVATAKASKAKISLVKALLKSKTAYRKYREKENTRLQELLVEKAIDARIVDESMDHLESAVGAEEAGKEAIITAGLDAEAAVARVEQAKADLKNAKAQVEVAKAELERSEAMLGYTKIVSPYDGIITFRGFYPGDFIRSAANGADKQPLFSVEKVDKMRVVIQVPDRDVPYVDEGDEVLIHVEALPELPIIKAKVSRCAKAEDLSTRTMRTEVDIPNPTGKLRRGMFGRVTIILTKGTPNSVTIPTSAISDQSATGSAKVHVVRNDHVEIVPVRIGKDNGTDCEVISGLTKDDLVITQANGPIDAGTPVTVSSASQQSAH